MMVLKLLWFVLILSCNVSISECTEKKVCVWMKGE